MLKILKEVLEARHPIVATSLNNIGLCYEAQWKYAEALEYYSEALEIRREVLGEQHPDTLNALRNIEDCKEKL